MARRPGRLLTKTERFHVHIVTELNEEQTRGMRMTKVQIIGRDALTNISATATGYIMPRGAALLPWLIEEFFADLLFPSPGVYAWVMRCRHKSPINGALIPL